MKNFKFKLLLLSALISQQVKAQQPGDLDSTFNSIGYNTLDMQTGRDNEAYAIAIQSDNRIVVAGYMYDGDYDNVAIARYFPNGTLDNSFNSTGYMNLFINDNCSADAVAIQTDGKIVVAGRAYYSNTGDDFLILRLNSDGTYDNTFGTNGVVTTDFNGYYDVINAIEIQSNGKIIAVGSANTGIHDQLAIARYNSNGTLDNTFSTDGIDTVSIGLYNSDAYSVAIQSNGKIVVGGSSENNLDYDFSLLRYNSNGTLDNTFNSTGIVITDIDGYNEEIKSLELQTDGKIVAAGYANNDSDDDFCVARYNSDGTIDNSFDTDGHLITDFFSDDERAYSVKIQQDNKIVTSGYTYDGINQVYLFALARYNTDGSMDNSFGGDGLVTTNIGNNYDALYASLIQSDGKIVVAGASYDTIGANYDFAIARYLTGTNVGFLDFSSSINSVLIYPNPINELTHLEYGLSNAENISVLLMDAQGKLISVLIDRQHQSAGKHRLNFHLKENLSAGTYLLRIISINGQVNIKMIKD